MVTCTRLGQQDQAALNSMGPTNMNTKKGERKQKERRKEKGKKMGEIEEEKGRRDR